MARSPPAPAGHRGAWAQRGGAPVPPRRRRLRTVAARVPAAKLCAGWEAGARSRRGEGPPPPPPPPRARGARRAPPSAAPGGAGQRPGGPAGGAGESSEPRRGQRPRWPPVCAAVPGSPAPRPPSCSPDPPAGPQPAPGSAHGRREDTGPQGREAAPAVLSESFFPSAGITVPQLLDPLSRPAPLRLPQRAVLSPSRPAAPGPQLLPKSCASPERNIQRGPLGWHRAAGPRSPGSGPPRIWSRVDRWQTVGRGRQ